jgi:hypothetical protein
VLAARRLDGGGDPVQPGRESCTGTPAEAVARCGRRDDRRVREGAPGEGAGAADRQVGGDGEVEHGCSPFLYR